MSWLSTARILYFVMNSTFQNTHHSCSSSSLSQHPPTPNLYPQKPLCDNFIGSKSDCDCEEGKTKLTVQISFSIFPTKSSGSYQVQNSGGDLLMESSSQGQLSNCYNGCGGLTIFSSSDDIEYLSYLAAYMTYPDGNYWWGTFHNSTTSSFRYPGPVLLYCPAKYSSPLVEEGVRCLFLSF